MQIQILFLHKRDWVGKTIQSLTHGDKTHCGIVINGLQLADTNFGRKFGVRFIPWNKCDYELITLDLRPLQYDEAILWVQSHKDVPYDDINNIRYLLGKKSNGIAKLNCVESVVEFLVDTGYLSPIYIEQNFSPTELYNILIERCKHA